MCGFPVLCTLAHVFVSREGPSGCPPRTGGDTPGKREPRSHSTQMSRGTLPRVIKLASEPVFRGTLRPISRKERLIAPSPWPGRSSPLPAQPLAAAWCTAIACSLITSYDSSQVGRSRVREDYAPGLPGVQACDPYPPSASVSPGIRQGGSVPSPSPWAGGEAHSERRSLGRRGPGGHLCP